jgi:hypothetical protein
LFLIGVVWFCLMRLSKRFVVLQFKNLKGDVVKV